jgi:hypothetical protein
LARFTYRRNSRRRLRLRHFIGLRSGERFNFVSQYEYQLVLVILRSNDESSNKRILRPTHPRDAILRNLAVRIEDECTLIGFNRLGAIAGFFISKPEASPSIGILIVNV